MFKLSLLSIIVYLGVFSNLHAKESTAFDYDKVIGVSIEEQIQNPEVVKGLERYLNTSLTMATESRLMVNGEIFLKKIELIRSAKEKIYLQNMILMDDPTGLRIAYELLEAAKRGVVVRIMLDAVASWSGSKHFIKDLDRSIRSIYEELKTIHPHIQNELEETDRSITIYKSPKKTLGLLPVVQHLEDEDLLIEGEWDKKYFRGLINFLNPHQYLGVMHDKVMVVDGRLGITSGINIADNYSHTGVGISKTFYFTSTERDVLKAALPKYWKKLVKQWGENLDQNHYDEKKGWRDTGVYLEGPVVGPMEASFIRHWDRARVYYPKKDARTKMSKLFSLKQSKFLPVTDQAFNLDYVEGLESVKNVKAMAIGQIPLEGEVYYTRFMRWAIESARKEITCQTPYAVFSKWMKDWLIKASERGVKVKLFTNSILSNDMGSSITWLARKNYVGLMDHGIQVFEWQMPTLHSKMCMIDGFVTLVGSNNNDVVGAYNSSEFGVAIFDHVFADGARRVLAEDERHSLRVTKKDLDQWGKTRFFNEPIFTGDIRKEWFLFKVLKRVYGSLEKNVQGYLEKGVYSH